MSHFSRHISTPIGMMVSMADTNGVTYLDFVEQVCEDECSEHPLLLQLEQELNEYFSKRRQVFTVPLSLSGTPFQKNVWDTLLKIPYATTLSYAQEAKLFGNPKATRAVANANSKNPISIIIPCHRVIASDGSIGGYSGGVWRKEFLLSLERE